MRRNRDAVGQTAADHIGRNAFGRDGVQFFRHGQHGALTCRAGVAEMRVDAMHQRAVQDASLVINPRVARRDGGQTIDLPRHRSQ